MYHTPESGRHWRSVWSQDTGAPAVVNFGKFGTAMPLTEDYCLALLDPFPTSKYSIDQLEQCGKDYTAYLQTCFEEYKGCVASQLHKKLVVIGRDVTPEAALASSLPHSRL